MSFPNAPTGASIVQIVEKIVQYTKEQVFGAGIDVTGTAVFRGAVRSVQGIATWIGLGVPAAASATSVAASLASNSAGNAFTVNANQPDVARNVTATFGASWDGGAVTIAGHDINGNAQTETLAANPGGITTGAKIFSSVASASKAAVGTETSANGCTLGTGTKLGIPGGMATGPAAAFYVVGISPDCGALDITNQGIDCSATPPDGSSIISVQVNQ